MYNLLIALLIGVVVTAAVKLFGFAIWAGIVPGTIAFLGSYFLLARRIGQKVQKITSEAQVELSAVPPNERERKVRIDKAIKLLETALVYDKWQFLIGSELHAQIGMIKYMTGDLEGAQKDFQHASVRNGLARAMEGALYYRKKDFAKMTEAF